MQSFKKIRSASVLLLLLVCALPFSVKADTTLFVSPTRVNLDDQNKIEIMNLSNLSDRPRHYKISIEDIIMTEKGVTAPSGDFPYSAKKMLRFYPRDVTIKPGERQAVRVMAKFPADTPDGQYHAHIKFFEDGKSGPLPDPITGVANKNEMVASIAYASVMPITVSKGEIDTKVGWTKPTEIVWNETDKQYKANFVLTRSGNGQGGAYIDILYVPTSGDPVQLGNRRTFYIYREIDKRDASLVFTLPQGASGGQIKLRLLTGDPSKQVPPEPVDEALLSIP